MSDIITRNILFGQGDVNGIITPLIPFNCVYDLDVGIVRFMYENGYTNNSDLIDTNFFKIFKSGNRKLISTLYSRVDENPLYLFMKDLKLADDFYVELMEKHMRDIIYSSIHTGIYEMCENFKTEKSITASIIYSNQTEYEMIKRDKKLAHIDLVDLESIKNLDQFSTVFFKSLDDMYIHLFAPNIKSKPIYLLDYRFNYDKNGTDLINNSNKALLELNRNIINIINAYDRSRLEVT